MNTQNLEIERKFLIALPDLALLQSRAEPSEIVQTYLKKTNAGQSARVRKRGRDGVYVYTHTCKTRLSDMSRIEIEREISEEEYRTLLCDADPERETIRKTRWVLPYRGESFEIDIYPFWKDRAIMEIELENEAQTVDFPPEIVILREVTGDRRYTNAAMAKKLPEDEWPEVYENKLSGHERTE